MNNNYFNFNPNSFIRNVPNVGLNPMGIRSIPRVVGLPRLSSLFGGSSSLSGVGSASKLTFSSFLTGAGKTLGVINQAIPVFYQVKPIWNNARTMLRVAREMKVDNNSSRNNISTNNINQSTKAQLSNSNNTQSEKKEDNSPTFFI